MLENQSIKNDSVVDDMGTYRSTADAREARSTWLAANLAVQAAKAELSRAASAVLEKGRSFCVSLVSCL